MNLRIVISWLQSPSLNKEVLSNPAFSLGNTPTPIFARSSHNVNIGPGSIQWFSTNPISACDKTYQDLMVGNHALIAGASAIIL